MLALIFTTFMIQLVAHSLHYFRCAAHAWTTIVSIIWSVALELFALHCFCCLEEVLKQGKLVWFTGCDVFK